MTVDEAPDQEEHGGPRASADTAGRPGQSRVRLPRAQRLEQVVGVAEELFVRYGYQQTSMDEVARLVGVSKPVVYDLVGSKEELYARCVARSADRLAATVAGAVAGVDGAAGADGADGVDRLRAGAVAFFRFVDGHRLAWRGLLSAGSSPAEVEVSEARRRQAGLVARLLVDSSPHDRVDPVVAEAVANALNGAFEALAGWWYDHEEYTAERLADLVVALFEPGLEALLGIGATRPATPLPQG